MHRVLFQYHPQIGYLFTPDLQARIDHEGGGYLLRTNSQGFRCGHEFVARKQPDTFRILLFGDSYTAGDGVSDPYRYGDRLEALLPNTEVFNFGLPGSATDQHYLIFQEFAAHLEFDLVVIAVLVENIRRIAARYRPFVTPRGEARLRAKPYFTLGGDGSLHVHHVPVPKGAIAPESLPAGDRQAVDEGGNLATVRRYVNRAGPHAKAVIQRLTNHQPLPAYDAADNPDWRLMQAILRQWIREIPTPTVVVPIPLYHHIEGMASPKGYQQRFAELTEASGARLHDPLPDLLAYPAAQRRQFRFKRDIHPTREGHEALAGSLANGLAMELSRP